MAQRLKRWESPRRQGRNEKGKGGSARQRQLKKQQQMLRKKLKDNPQDSRNPKNNKEGGDISSSPFFVFTQSCPTSVPSIFRRHHCPRYFRTICSNSWDCGGLLKNSVAPACLARKRSI